MRRLLIALLAGVAVAVPASVGLLGNASFAERLPLHSPTSDLSSSAPESRAMRRRRMVGPFEGKCVRQVQQGTASRGEQARSEARASRTTAPDPRGARTRRLLLMGSSDVGVCRGSGGVLSHHGSRGWTAAIDPW